MSRLELPDNKSLAEIEPLKDIIEEIMGFVPNSLLQMGRHPAIAKAIVELAAIVMSPDHGTVDVELKYLIAHIASSAAGCRYCMAHTAHSANKVGSTADRIENVWEFASSPYFTDAEKAVLGFARDAAVLPNAVTDAGFEELKQFYSADEITEIVSVISLFGFLNRWNDTFATELEETPLAFAKTLNQ